MLLALALTLAVTAPWLLGERPSQPTRAAAERPVSSTPPPAPRRLSALTAESWRIELPVPGHASASVSVPLGATEPRPVVIALHGIADRPEWQCGTWRGISDGHPFVLCPRGIPSGGGQDAFTYPDLERTERELRRALTALKARFGDHVASGGVVLAGYSLGATRAAAIARREPSFFANVVFVEGGHETWTASHAAVFQEGGGKSVLFVCAQPRCVEAANVKRQITERAGLRARLVDAGPLGHVFDGRVAQAVKEAWPWLVAEDPRFRRAE